MRRKLFVAGLAAKIMCITRTGALVGLLLLSVVEAWPRERLLKEHIVLRGGDLHGCHVLQDDQVGCFHLWLAGTPANATQHCRQIYHATSQDLVSWPTPELCLGFGSDLAAMEVEDPCVLRAPLGFGVSRRFVGFFSVRPRLGMLRRPYAIWMGNSEDGRVWHDLTPVIPSSLVSNVTNAWHPSGVVKDNEIWLYYSSDWGQRLMRTRFRRADSTSNTQVVLDDGTSRFHPTVTRCSEQVWLLHYNASREERQAIYRMTSRDGLHWKSEEAAFLVANATPGEISELLSPFFFSMDKGNYLLYFGRGNQTNMLQADLCSRHYRIETISRPIVARRPRRRIALPNRARRRGFMSRQRW